VIEAFAFWSFLLLPGLVTVRLMAVDELRGGLLPAVAMGYLGSFALLAPISALAYLAELPVAVLSGAILCLVLAAIVVALRLKLHRELASPLRWGALAGLLLLTVHIAWAAREGTWLRGDTTFHLGRIRFLLDHGISNDGFYVESEPFVRIYHTNLLHALIASASQLTGLSALELWYASAAWAKLVTACGHAYLAHAISGRRWAGWACAALSLTTLAAVPYSLYPNSLGTWWLLPTLLGLGVRNASHDRVRIGPTVLLCLGAVAISQVHALYALFWAFCLGPYLALRVARDRRLRSGSVLGLVALLLVAPHVHIVLGRDRPTAPRTDQSERWRAAVERDQAQWLARNASRKRSETIARFGGGPLEKKLEATPDGNFHLPFDAIGGLLFVLSGWLALLWSSWIQASRRDHFLALALALAGPCIVLFVPAICTAAVGLSTDFVVVRLAPLVSLFAFTALATVAAPADDTPTSDRVGTAVLVACALIGTQLPGHAPRSWSDHAHAAMQPEAARTKMLRRLQMRAQLLTKYVPAGSTVAASLQLARHVVMLHDCFVVAPDRGTTDVADILERRFHVVQFTDPNTAEFERSALLKTYGIRHAVFSAGERERFAWTLRRGKRLATRAGWTVVDLQPKRLPDG